MIRFLDIKTYRKESDCIGGFTQTKTEQQISFNDTMWKKIKWLIYQNQNTEKKLLIPIEDEQGNIICYAYEDPIANRQLRQLTELLQLGNKALQFENIYPSCEKVIIYGCNELAYFFVKYLETRGIKYNTVGKYWNKLKINESYDQSATPMQIFAEGTNTTQENLLQQIFTSIACEFECVDKIYEENIKQKIVRDADMDKDFFLRYLQVQKEIVLIGTDIESQSAYNFLLECNIEIICFLTLEKIEYEGVLYGIPVWGMNNIIRKLKKPIFLQCQNKNSAWGIGYTDLFAYLGYKRNYQFFLLNDYFEIKENSILTVLNINLKQQHQIYLAGDFYLCKILFDILTASAAFTQIITFWDVLKENRNLLMDMPACEEIKVQATDIILLLIPEFFCPPGKKYGRERNQCFMRIINEKVANKCTISDYYSHMITFLSLEKKRGAIKYQGKKTCIPKGIIIESAESCSGNIFIRGLLDGHPNIYMLQESNFFCENIFWISERLSLLHGKEIKKKFWEICDLEQQTLSIKRENVEEILECKIDDSRQYSAQELFILFIEIFSQSYGRELKKISESVIYWEIHFLDTWLKEEFAGWLSTDSVQLFILNIVRDARIANGSIIKIYEKNNSYLKAIEQVRSFDFRMVDKKDFKNTQRITIKFEQIKTNPDYELHELCRKLGIPFDDAIMHTTRNGKIYGYDNGDRIIKDFDLTPVYNRYENYFTDFDRFRINILYGIYLNKYGYDFVPVEQFSRKELKNFFLKKFFFEEKWDIDIMEIIKWMYRTEMDIQQIKCYWMNQDDVSREEYNK